MKKNITDASQSRNMIKQQLSMCSSHSLKLCRWEIRRHYRLVQVVPSGHPPLPELSLPPESYPFLEADSLVPTSVDVSLVTLIKRTLFHVWSPVIFPFWIYFSLTLFQIAIGIYISFCYYHCTFLWCLSRGQISWGQKACVFTAP